LVLVLDGTQFNLSEAQPAHAPEQAPRRVGTYDANLDKSDIGMFWCILAQMDLAGIKQRFAALRDALYERSRQLEANP